MSGREVLKDILRLVHQGGPVGQEEGVRNIAAPGEDIGQAHRSPGFPGARRHHQKRLPVAFFKMVADRPYRLFLIITVGNPVVDLNRAQLLPGGPPVNQPLQVIRENTADPALWPGPVIPDKIVGTIGIKDDRPGARSSFQDNRRIAGPGGSPAGILKGPFGFDYSQGQPVFPPEDIVDKAFPEPDSRGIPNTRISSFDTVPPVSLGERPAQEFQIHINVLLLRGKLRQVLRGKYPFRFILFFMGCKLRALFPEFRQEPGDLFYPFHQ